MTKKRKPKIGFLLRDFGEGGTERVFLELVRHFRDNGWDAVLILFAVEGELLSRVPADIHVIPLEKPSSSEKKSFPSLSIIYSLSRVLDEENVDILLSAKERCNFLALLARTFSRTGTKVVLTRHVPFLHDPSGGASMRGSALLYRFLYPFSDAIVGVSDGLVADIARLLPRRARNKLHRIYNPVLDAEFYLRADTKTGCWPNEDKFVFIGVGRLAHQKGFDVLLEAFAHVADGSQSLVLVGDGPARRQLEAQADRLGVSSSVLFTGRVENTLPAIKRADCLVMSSRYEGFGIVLVEALALGTRVISTDCEYGPDEILNRGEFGQLVSPEDPMALAEAMRRAQRGEEPIKAGIDLSRYTSVHAGERYEMLCRSLLVTN